MQLIKLKHSLLIEPSNPYSGRGVWVGYELLDGGEDPKEFTRRELVDTLIRSISKDGCIYKGIVFHWNSPDWRVYLLSEGDKVPYDGSLAASTEHLWYILKRFGGADI
jgi:hypothetical protein